MSGDWRVELADLDEDTASVVLLMRIEEHVQTIRRVVVWFAVIYVVSAMLAAWALLVAAIGPR